MFERIKKFIKNGYYDVKLHTRKRMIERNIKIRGDCRKSLELLSN